MQAIKQVNKQAINQAPPSGRACDRKAVLKIRGRQPDPNNQIRKNQGFKPRSNRKGRTAADDPRNDSFCHVTGSLKAICQAQLAIQPGLMHKWLSQVAPLVCSHPQFQDKEWTAQDNISDVLHHIISEFQRITPEDLTVIFHISDLEVTPYWIKECDACYSYGNLLPCDWLATLGRKHRQLYQLAIDFFSFCVHRLHMPIWNEWDEEAHIEYVEEELANTEEYGTELDEDEIKELRQSITYYRKHAVGQYAKKVHKNEISVATFAQRLKDYKPRKSKYRRFKNWMISALEIHRLGFNFRDADCPFIIPEDFYNNGELEPYRYIRFIWSSEDPLGKGVTNSICENAGNIGIIPLVEFEIVNEKDISNPSKFFGKATTFYNWLSDGHQITNNLYQ